MSYILNIDTAVVSASVSLGNDDKPLNLLINPSQKDHAAWLHLAIKKIFQETGSSLEQLDAIAVSAGPGSYTGLRVGMATAKGLCYALKKPLIAIGTLEMMAVAAQSESTTLLCPMIDARRMEVFTAIFDHNLKTILPPTNIILNEKSFQEVVNQHSVTFFGNGSDKFKDILPPNESAQFRTIEANAKHMVVLAFNKLQQRSSMDLAYTEPSYGKDFYLNSVKPS